MKTRQNRRRIEMAMMPKRVKFRKAQRGRRSGSANKGSQINFGDCALKSIENGWIKAIEIEAARVAVMRHTRRAGKMWIRIFPDKPVTKKPAETRQGKGKGALDHWVAVVKKGRIIFEMEGIPLEVSREAMRLAANKLSLKTKFVSRVH
ncbi:MAG: 50S ribosomal protein L16 [Candidatus Omnitrophica bacterium]|nr:50S ribosomal protein L16 [Candidatus Omnitrophota bacterium]